MKNFVKVILLFLIVLAVFSSIFGQNKKSKLIEKNLLQGRDLTHYAQVNYFDCRFSLRLNDKCDKQKAREFIEDCWTEKHLCYITITYNGTDSGSTKHIFIELNQKNQWQIVRRLERSDIRIKNPIEDLPTAFSVEKVKDKRRKGEWSLVFKNKFGKIIDEL